MKKIFLSAIFVVCAYNAIAQTNTTATKVQPVHVNDVIITKDNQADINIDVPNSNNNTLADTATIFVAVEKEPDFPGGMDKFHKYINKNKKLPDLQYPEWNGPVKEIVTFIVERNGSLTHVKILRGISNDYDTEAIRLIEQSPKWTPGIQNGRTVRTSYTIVISYEK